MAIQLRHGAYADFQPNKMTTAEPAVVTSGDPNTTNGKSTYVAYGANDVERLLTDQDKTAQDAINAQTTAALSGMSDDIDALEQDVDDLKSDLSDVQDLSITDQLRSAILACFQNVAFLDDGEHYSALFRMLLGNYPKLDIVADFSSIYVRPTTPLDDLKNFMTVTYYEDASSSGVVLRNSDYDITGNLKEGKDFIEVQYDDVISYVPIQVDERINEYEYSIRDVMVEPGNFLLYSGLYNNLVVNLAAAQLSTKRGFVLDNGTSPFLRFDNGDPTEFYPIPIPEDAVRAVASIAPNTMQLAIYIGRLNTSTSKYEILNTPAYTSGSVEAKFKNGNNGIAVLCARYDSSGSEFVTDPSGFNLKFDSMFDCWHWDMSNLTKENGNFMSYNGIGSNLVINRDPAPKPSPVNTRRGFVANRGMCPFSDYLTGNPTDLYPIQIPKDATKVTATIAPNTMYLALYVSHYDEATGKYTTDASTGWQLGSATLTFAKGNTNVLTTVIKYNAAGTAFVSEPTGFTIDFE